MLVDHLLYQFMKMYGTLLSFQWQKQASVVL